MPEDWENGGFGLYIHWPFCQAKCPYCDFNSHVSASIDQNRWADAFIAELERHRETTGNRILRSVFFGGGTPSLMEPETVHRIMDKVLDIWRMTNNPEITLEANPTSVEAGRFRGYRDAGVNRVSMGIQALNNADLRKLGRLHSVEEAMKAFDIARGCFDRVSFDLIYARQDQTLADWKSELELALSLAVDHLSVYQLTIEEGTAFGDRYAAGKLRGLPSDDNAADMYDLTQEVCEKHGFPSYEVSNHARPEAESIHNKLYWQYGDYIGIGPGAHGRLTLSGHRYATEAHRNPNMWLNLVETKGTGATSHDLLGPQDELTEFLLMGMRLVEGGSIQRTIDLGGAAVLENAGPLAEQGLVEFDNGRLCVTASGRPILNAVLRELLID